MTAPVLHCPSCRHFQGGYYCEYLKHALNHGYAMRYHGQFCGGYEK